MEIDGLVRTGGRAVAALRIALGVSSMITPPARGDAVGRLVDDRTRGHGAGPGGRGTRHRPGRRGPARRAQGARAERTWVALAAFCDVVDAATTVVHWRRLPSPGRLLVSAAAAGAAVVGVAATVVAQPDRRAS